jgi:hypothetical protein
MDKVGEQLPAVATTVASLVLVFFGLIIAAWESYNPEAKASVRSRFRHRAWTTFFAFLAAVLSATFGLIGIGTAHKCLWPDVVGVVLLGLSGILMASVGLLALLEMER